MKTPLSARITFRYVTAYSHLDEWEQIGTYRELHSHPVARLSDDNSRVSRVLVSVASIAPPSQVKEALRNSFEHACRCEHDCCGHFQSYARNVRRVGKSSLYLVSIYGSRSI